MVEIPVTDELEQAIWETLIGLTRDRSSGWTLVGAQMVALHGFDAGRERIRVSTDADVLIDVRITPTGTEEFSAYLESLGFQLEGVSAEGIGHRFARGEVKIDVLAPDGLGRRANVRTVGTARTVQVPGGSQALKRTVTVDVELGETVGAVPRPDLVGAILVKARAVEVDDAPDAQRLDLAFLLSLVVDPSDLRGQMTSTERGWLRRRTELNDRTHFAWQELPQDYRDDAFASFLILSK